MGASGSISKSKSTASLRPNGFSRASVRRTGGTKYVSKRQTPANESTKETEIDSFVLEVYQNISCYESLDNVILHKSGEDALLRFLKQEYCEENLQFYLDVEAVKMGGADNVTRIDPQYLLDTYLSTESTSEVNISFSLKNHITKLIKWSNDCSVNSQPDEVRKEELLTYLASAQAEVKSVLALGALPRFFVSPIFAEWRESQAAQGTQVLFRSRSGEVSENTGTAYNPVEEILLEQLDTVLGCNQWLRALLSSLESIPVCVSVAAANSSYRTFPLIYVNKSFEKSTGYFRSEVIGKNCRFLQCGKDGAMAEEESVAQLTKALADGASIKLAITNFRKDGSPFRNLAAIKPIFDEKGDYAFVVGMQFDTGQHDATPAELRLLDTFFSLLPDTVVSGPDIRIPLLREAVLTTLSGRLQFGVEPISPGVALEESVFSSYNGNSRNFPLSVHGVPSTMDGNP